MDNPSPPRDPYLIHSVLHAAELLKAFSSPDETLRLKDILKRTDLSKGIAFRLLYTLEKGGLVEKTGKARYRARFLAAARRKHRIGFAAQGAHDRFSEAVTQSLKWAAEKHGDVDLVLLDNRYSGRTAEKNVELFLRERVALAIEFQTDEHTAPVISARLREASIPMIAVDIPHPGATYFGANNFEAGLLAGRCLGRWAKDNWSGQVDEVLLLELPRAGVVPQARLTGTLEGIREHLPRSAKFTVKHLDVEGHFDSAWRTTRRYLKSAARGHTLIGGINDPSVIGALRAFEEAGRLPLCAAAGQGGSPEGRHELRRGGRFIGTVAYFPEKYGELLIALAMDILGKKPVPPAVFVEHQLLTQKNVNHYYSNDNLLERIGLDGL